MAWIESHESLPNHPKTKRLCRMLKITPVVAVGHLHYLWWWAMNHAQDGSLEKYSPDDIADACEWTGDSDEYWNALINSGFIDKTSSGFVVHDWHDYAGKLIAIRQKDAERKRKSRGKDQVSNGHPTDIQRTSKGTLPESTRDLDLDLNQDLLKQSTTPSVNPFRLFESEGFGMLTEIIGQKIGDMIDDFSERWVCEAMKEASFAGKRSLPYVKGILQRYRTSGIDEPWTLEKEPPKQQPPRSYGRPQAPKMSVVKDDGSIPSVSPEELERLAQRARERKERGAG